MERLGLNFRFWKRDIIGCVDSITHRYVTGWAVDRSAPSRPVDLQVVVGETPIAYGKANRDRADLLAHAPGGRCAFMIPVDQGVPDIRVLAEGYELPRASGFSIDLPERQSRFELRAPSHQNAIDIFAGKWAKEPASKADDGDPGAGDPQSVFQMIIPVPATVRQSGRSSMSWMRGSSTFRCCCNSARWIPNSCPCSGAVGMRKINLNWRTPFVSTRSLYVTIHVG